MGLSSLRARVGRSVRHVARTDELATDVARLRAEQVSWASTLTQVSQRGLALQYQDLLAKGRPLPGLEAAEFRVYSQNGEDGILHYIFALIGVTNKYCLEMCAGDGRECNTANLIINHGWEGLLFDGHPELVERGRAFFAELKDTTIWGPQFAHAWITAENVNALIEQHGWRGEIDLLSLDLDGVDWWVWRALDVVQPRVVVVEYQDCWPADVAVTVPYRPDFVAINDDNGIPAYAGASLAAFTLLAQQKGYRLVGCQRLGYNAFFVREGLGEHALPAMAVAQGLQHPCNMGNMATRRPRVEGLEWVDVHTVLGD